MAYENLCMYCFEDMQGQTTCPHCGRDSRAAVPQVQMLPGSLVYHSRFLIGRALGQDAAGIVYAAFDTQKENKLRIREYLPRDCAERLNDGAVVPVAGKEDEFEAGIKKLRASVESVEDPRKRHFFFEENGTAYIAQRKSAAAASSEAAEDEGEGDGGNRRRILGRIDRQIQCIRAAGGEAQILRSIPLHGCPGSSPVIAALMGGQFQITHADLIPVVQERNTGHGKDKRIRQFQFIHVHVEPGAHGIVVAGQHGNIADLFRILIPVHVLFQKTADISLSILAEIAVILS